MIECVVDVDSVYSSRLCWRRLQRRWRTHTVDYYYYYWEYTCRHTYSWYICNNNLLPCGGYQFVDLSFKNLDYKATTYSWASCAIGN